jgi:hypothetical protein
MATAGANRLSLFIVLRSFVLRLRIVVFERWHLRRIEPLLQLKKRQHAD